MTSPRVRLLLALLTSCGLGGCSQPSDGPPANPNAPRLVGRIAAVPVDQPFVLIQSYGKWTAPPGTVLTTRGPDGRSANLRATGETSGHFAAADVQSGTLAQGDGVYAAPEPAPTSTDPPEDTPTGTSPPPTPPSPQAPAKPSETPEIQGHENSLKK